MADAILTLNAGSSSLKFGLFEAVGERLDRVAAGEVEGIGSAPRFIARADGRTEAEQRWPDRAAQPPDAFLTDILRWIDGRLGERRLRAVGHRIVHGGAVFDRPVRIDATVMAELAALSPLAPLHQPHNLAAVDALAKARPDLVQVACFDTVFHRGHAPEVDRFGLPRQWEARGLRRYGFHGLSYEFIAGRMRTLDPDVAAGRMVVAHLGNGASLCAIHAGRSVDTTMSLTPLDGLVMGTRCGSIDPGAILYLQRQGGLTPAQVEELLYHRSGLLGVSAMSGDMRELLASDDPKAADAVDLFVFRIVRDLGAMTASMGGVDGLVFTGGIGEKSPEIRRRVCERLAWLGVALDAAANDRGGGRISAPASRLAVWAVPTDEEAMIAAHTRSVAAI